MSVNIDYSIPDKVLKYEEFLNDCLKEDLKKVHAELDGVTSELAEYIQLKNTIQTFIDTDISKEGLKTKVDIGCNFYMQAHIQDVSKICINVGCGHFVEFTLNEALLFIEKRLNLLNKMYTLLKKRSANTKAHIKLVLHGIQELQNIK
ncbi:uxt prefoldin-like subunit [Lycorma delicatula]|uniref:uxt prefoldin-like subunit n=1 Tax=Lycorma delicatula TaxID=130591 RepID=UPI003F50E7D3